MERVVVYIVLACACAWLVEAGLYAPRTPITQLDTNTFYDRVPNSQQTWIVEFYAVWCGHCQRFAPVYSQFSREVAAWRGFRVAAVDCALDINRVVCYAENVWVYPAMKFYPQGSDVDNHGDPYTGTQGVSALMRGSVNYMSEQQARGVQLRGVPRLQPYTDIGEILEPHNRATFVLVVDSDLAETKLPQVVILDLSDLHPEVKVAWVLAGTSGLQPLDAKRPAIFSLREDSSLEAVQFDMSRAKIVQAIRQAAAEVPTKPPPTTTPATTSTNPSTTPRIRVSDDVHMQDLVSSLFYSLFMEVAMMPVIQNQSLDALKTHMQILAKYHPGESHTMRFLLRASRWLDDQEGPLTGEQWLTQLQSLQSDRAYIPQEATWAACAGSEDNYRGCPCALWQTFHALTVNAFLQHRRDPAFDPKEIPIAMREYIRHFFRCRSCARHFVGMAASINDLVKAKHDGMLWLWAAHNKVNARLHGDASEDPQHPKVQFPTRMACRGCRALETTVSPFYSNVRWNVGRVKRHLLKFYRKKNIVLNNP